MVEGEESGVREWRKRKRKQEEGARSKASMCRTQMLGVEFLWYVFVGRRVEIGWVQYHE